MKNNRYEKQVNSHIVMFDKPKVAIVRGYIVKVYGMIFSQYVGEYDIATHRTLLTGEDLNPLWTIDSEDDDYLCAMHVFTDFPKLSMKDVYEIVSITYGVRDLYESFEDLNELGCIYPKEDSDWKMMAYRESDSPSRYNFVGEGIFLTEQGTWIPSVLEKLYTLQSYLGRRIVMKAGGGVTAEELELMNRLLENQFKYKMYEDGMFDTDRSYYNDGVNTYCTDGTITPMTREEFLAKYPDAYEVAG